MQHPQPTRVVFGAGRLAELADEVDALGLARLLVLCTPGHRSLGERAAELLGDRSAGVHAGAVQHVPVATADEAAARAREVDADGCVAIGGGSTVGLGKAVALREGLPVVAVPTTYSGSEMTPVWGLTDADGKRTGRDPRVRPSTVLYDPELTTSLPVTLSATSAVNALAHAAEALWAPDTTPVVALQAAEAARALLAGLSGLAATTGSAPGSASELMITDSGAEPSGSARARPTDRDLDGLDARSDLLYGAWLAGTCLGVTTMGLHHQLCHLLGGGLGLPHAETHTVVLPHVLAATLPAAPDAAAALERALGGPPAGVVADVAARLGAPTGLGALGADRGALPAIAARAAASPYPHPVALGEPEITALLDAAWIGPPPR